MGYQDFEADHFFMKDGEYRFDEEHLTVAHAWCLDQVRQALSAGYFVCVANVFATKDDIHPYIELCADYKVVEATCAGQSIHKIPAAKMHAMQAKWTSTADLLKGLQAKAAPAIAMVADESSIPDLIFPMVEYGRNQIPWDLRVLLYKGASGFNYKTVFVRIAAGEFGRPRVERIELVRRIHEEMIAILIGGGSRNSTYSTFRKFRWFVAWADGAGQVLSLETVEVAFREWCDYLFNRVRLKLLKEMPVYGKALEVSGILDAVLGRDQPLIRTTRLRSKRKRSTRAVSPVADKQNLSGTFAFGHLLLDVIDSLPLEVIYGKLPVTIRTRDGRSIENWSGLPAPKKCVSLQPGYRERRNTEKSKRRRAAWEAEHTLRTRSSLVNLRIVAEMMLFIGQTGMNLSQAKNLLVTQYAYESTIDGYRVYAYKERAKKEVLFEIFTDYKLVFEDYLAWRVRVFGDTTDRLFPYVHRNGGSEHNLNYDSKFRYEICKSLGIPWVSTQKLRSTRVKLAVARITRS